VGLVKFGLLIVIPIMHCNSRLYFPTLPRALGQCRRMKGTGRMGLAALVKLFGKTSLAGLGSRARPHRRMSLGPSPVRVQADMFQRWNVWKVVVSVASSRDPAFMVVGNS
jgi:hypothetical protein